MSQSQDAAQGGNDNGRRRGKRLQPHPRRRTDLMGFKSSLWMAVVWVLLILVFLFPFPWWL